MERNRSRPSAVNESVGRKSGPSGFIVDSTPPRDFFKAWRWCPQRSLCVNQNAGDRQGLPPARDTLRRTPTAISLAGCVPAEPTSRFSRPTYATKSQLLIQIIRTPPLCLQKSTFPGLPTINPDGPQKSALVAFWVGASFMSPPPAKLGQQE